MVDMRFGMQAGFGKASSVICTLFLLFVFLRLKDVWHLPCV